MLRLSRILKNYIGFGKITLNFKNFVSQIPIEFLQKTMIQKKIETTKVEEQKNDV